MGVVQCAGACCDANSTRLSCCCRHCTSTARPRLVLSIMASWRLIMWRTSDAAQPRPTAQPSSVSCWTAAWIAPPLPREAEVVVLNTCTVTASADQDARAAIRRIHRENPGARILVTGCYAQRAPEELSALPGVSLVVGNSHKHRTRRLRCAAGERRADSFRLRTDRRRNVQGLIVGDIFAHTELMAAPVFDGDALREDAPQSQSAGRLQ